MPWQLGERSRRGALLDLAGGQLADDLARADERLGLEPGLVGPVEVVDGTVERFQRRHAIDGWLAVPSWRPVSPSRSRDGLT